MAKETIENKLNPGAKCIVPSLPYIKGKERVECKGCSKYNDKCCSYFSTSAYEKEKEMVMTSFFGRKPDNSQNYQAKTDEGQGPI